MKIEEIETIIDADFLIYDSETDIRFYSSIKLLVAVAKAAKEFVEMDASMYSQPHEWATTYSRLWRITKDALADLERE